MSIERATFPLVAAAGGLFAMATDDYWVDTGRPELYLQANLDVLAGTRRHDRCERRARRRHVSIRQPSCEHSVVGAGSTVGDATIARSVLLPGAVVEDGAVVTDSVIMGRVGAGAVVHNSVLGADGVIAPGEHVSDERRPDPNAGPVQRVNVLVVGGAGFIGSHLTERLLAEGHTVDVVDLLSSGSLANLSNARSLGGDLKIHTLDAGAEEFQALVAMRRPT